MWQRGSVRVLIIEDDDRIASPMVKGLEAEGLDVERVATGGDALIRVQSRAEPGFDVVLLDLWLPDIDGFEVCQRIRATNDVPIIVVTARSEEVHRVFGLELGADDYVVKPVGFAELLARIRAVTRRANARPPAPPLIDLGPLVIDRRTRRVSVDASDVTLTQKEFDLLALFAEDPDAVWPRQRILQELWDPHWYGPTKTLDVHIATLRKKLGHPEWIETVRGVGFRLRIATDS